MSEFHAVAHPNIAVIKYWGKRDIPRNLPAVSSVSLTLSPFLTETTLTWGSRADRFQLDGAPALPGEAQKVFQLLDRMAPGRPSVEIDSHNSFPTGSGLASSASGFAALVAVFARAAGLDPDPISLSRWARQGSGSACRSFWGGWVAWQKGTDPAGADSHGMPLDPGPWDVVMVVGVVSTKRKAVGSTEAMERARRTSPAWPAWLDTSEPLVQAGIAAIRARDLPTLGELMERSTLLMHATAWTSVPPVVYWQPNTLAAWLAVAGLRAEGIAAWATMDAGPQVKVLCARSDVLRVIDALTPVVERVVLCEPGPAPSVR